MLPLFYTSPTPLDGKAHQRIGLRPDFGFAFAQGAQAVPVNAVEMSSLCHCYPIVFVPGPEVSAVALLGLQESQNLFVDADGQWADGLYIPAYIRRYPFILSQMPGGENLLCVDMKEEVIEQDGGQPFFDPHGRPSQVSARALDFCSSYDAAAKQTAALCKWLRTHCLLVDRVAQIQVGKAQIKFSGFQIVDPAALAGLAEPTLLEAFHQGWLPFIYAHVFSASQWERLTQRWQLREVEQAVAQERNPWLESSDLASLQPLRRAFSSAGDLGKYVE
ncbi:MAG: SapC family protein [Verrucomicrobiota bacterium]